MRTMVATHHSRVGLICALSLMLSMLTGCGREPTPIPSEHSAFIGVWEQGRYGRDTTYEYLQISADGYFSYARIERHGGASKCVVLGKSPAKFITDTEIRASILLGFTMDFEINEPPIAVGDTLRVTIDGHVLNRTDSRTHGFDYSWSCDDGDLIRAKAI